ncbi:MAG: hypothetical protein WAU01_06730 [Saprospiraceae bacterium]
MNLIKIVIWIAMILEGYLAFGQPVEMYKIRGNVKDEVTNSPLIGSLVCS